MRMRDVSRRVYRIEDMELDAGRALLRRNGGEIPLRPKSLLVLLCLIENRGRIVSKDELFSTAWPDTAVTDDALVQVILETRKALGDDPRRPRLIRNHPRLGYSFAGEVQEAGSRELSIELEETTTVEVEVAPGRSWMPVAAAAALAVALTAGAIWWRARDKSPALAVEGSRRTLAVLFFENRSNTAGLDWLREGLSDMLITNLSRSPQLAVLHREQLARMLGSRRGASIPLDEALEIARRSQAAFVIAGAFASLGDTVRVDAQLYESANGRLVAGESLTAGNPEKLLGLVDSFAARLATRLGVSLAPGQLAGLMTRDLEAYRLYSLGVGKARALRSAEAIDLLQQALKRDPGFAMAEARIGYTYAVAWGRLDDAKPYLENAYRASSRLTPRDRLEIAAWYAIANRDYASVIAHYRQLVDAYPGDVEPVHRLARALRGEGRAAEALEVLRRGLERDPNEPEYHNLLSGIFAEAGRHDEAVAAAKRYVELQPSEPNALDSLGLVLQWAGRNREAFDAFNAALGIKPDFEIARVHLGNLYFGMGQYRRALTEYTRYVESAPSGAERSRGHGSRALVYWRLGQTDRAIEEAAEAQRLLPSQFHIAARLAIDRGGAAEAERWMPRLVKDSWPDDRGGARLSGRFHYTLLGDAAMARGRVGEALEMYRKSVAERPLIWSSESFEDCLARALLAAGRHREAVDEYRRVLRVQPGLTRARYYLGLALEGAGDGAAARAEFARFLEDWREADRDIPEVVDARRRL